jgi:hypothetical protein
MFLDYVLSFNQILLMGANSAMEVTLGYEPEGRFPSKP